MSGGNNAQRAFDALVCRSNYTHRAARNLLPVRLTRAVPLLVSICDVGQPRSQDSCLDWEPFTVQVSDCSHPHPNEQPESDAANTLDNTFSHLVSDTSDALLDTDLLSGMFRLGHLACRPRRCHLSDICLFALVLFSLFVLITILLDWLPCELHLKPVRIDKSLPGTILPSQRLALLVGNYQGTPLALGAH